MGRKGEYAGVENPAEKSTAKAVVDKVNHPAHYGGDTVYEPIKVIEAWELGFNLGNCIKYIGRHKLKGKPLEDLKKAQWYLEREIAKLSL